MRLLYRGLRIRDTARVPRPVGRTGAVNFFLPPPPPGARRHNILILSLGDDVAIVCSRRIATVFVRVYLVSIWPSLPNVLKAFKLAGSVRRGGGWLLSRKLLPWRQGVFFTSKTLGPTVFKLSVVTLTLKSLTRSEMLLYRVAQLKVAYTPSVCLYCERIIQNWRVRVLFSYRLLPPPEFPVSASLLRVPCWWKRLVLLPNLSQCATLCLQNLCSIINLHLPM